MSDATKERPDEVGVWTNGESVISVSGRVLTWTTLSPTMFPQSMSKLRDGRWEKLVPASELATLQADCERWSAMYAKGQDELVDMKFRLADAIKWGEGRNQVADAPDAAREAALVAENERLTARLAVVDGILSDLTEIFWRFPIGTYPGATTPTTSEGRVT